MKVEPNGQYEDWINRKWRPTTAWVYLTICVFDFIVFPILWSILQAYKEGMVNEAWVPLTLQGAGFFHVAMGAILGIAAWSRGREKIAGVHNVYNDNFYENNNNIEGYQEGYGDERYDTKFQERHKRR
jgi:hypothetical protein